MKNLGIMIQSNHIIVFKVFYYVTVARYVNNSTSIQRSFFFVSHFSATIIGMLNRGAWVIHHTYLSMPLVSVIIFANVADSDSFNFGLNLDYVLSSLWFSFVKWIIIRVRELRSEFNRVRSCFYLKNWIRRR